MRQDARTSRHTCQSSSASWAPYSQLRATLPRSQASRRSVRPSCSPRFGIPLLAPQRRAGDGASLPPELMAVMQAAWCERAIADDDDDDDDDGHDHTLQT